MRVRADRDQRPCARCRSRRRTARAAPASSSTMSRSRIAWKPIRPASEDLRAELLQGAGTSPRSPRSRATRALRGARRSGPSSRAVGARADGLSSHRRVRCTRQQVVGEARRRRSSAPRCPPSTSRARCARRSCSCDADVAVVDRHDERHARAARPRRSAPSAATRDRRARSRRPTSTRRPSAVRIAGSVGSRRFVTIAPASRSARCVTAVEVVVADQQDVRARTPAVWWSSVAHARRSISSLRVRRMSSPVSQQSTRNPGRRSPPGGVLGHSMAQRATFGPASLPAGAGIPALRASVTRRTTSGRRAAAPGRPAGRRRGRACRRPRAGRRRRRCRSARRAGRRRRCRPAGWRAARARASTPSRRTPRRRRPRRRGRP